MSDDWGNTPQTTVANAVVTNAVVTNAAAPKAEDIVDVKSRFKSATEIPGVGAFKVGWFALDKAGKSAMAVAPDVPRPIYAFDTENKLKIAVELLKPEDRKDIYILNLQKEVLDAEGNFDKEGVVPYMIETLKGIKDIEHGTIVIDSLTSLWDWIQYWFDNSDEIKRSDSGMPYRFEYGKKNSRFIELGELLQQTSMNVICTMKCKGKVNSDGSDAGYNIMQCYAGTGYFLEFYGELERVGKKRTFIVRGTNYGDLDGMKIDNPSFDTIRKTISKQTGIKFA